MSTKSITKLGGKMSSPKQFIEYIRRIRFGIDLGTNNLTEEQREHMEDNKEFREDAARLASDLHTEQPHFMLELIQNAEDNDYDESIIPMVKFIVCEDKLIIQNNEKGFTEENVRALCKAGGSTKRNKKMGYIGEKGIGFKSVFKVSSKPCIYSNGFQFNFIYDEKNPISIIIPNWVDDIPDFVDLRQTNIVLPLKDEVKNEVNKFIEIDPCLLLFLRKLKFIEIEDKIHNKSYLIERHDTEEKVKIVHPKREDYWRIVKSPEPLKVPTHIKEEKRRDVEETEIILAFPLKPDGSADASKEQNVFVYLPVRSYGFKFIIQADFLVPLSREDIHKDKSWNKWLRDNIADMFLRAVEEFKSDDKLKKTYYHYIPLTDEVTDAFFSPVVEQIQNKLREAKCILTESMNWLKPGEVFRADDDIRALIPNDDLKRFFDKEYISPDIKVDKQILDVLGVAEFKFSRLVECLQNEEWLKKQSDDWFVRLYSYLNKQKLKEEQMQKLKHLKIIRLENNELTSLSDGNIFLPLDKKGNYGFEIELRVINRTFMLGRDQETKDAITEFLKKLGVCNAHPYEIIENHILPIYRSDGWKNKDNKTLLGYIRYIKDNFEGYEKESDKRLNANKNSWERKEDPLKRLKDSLFIRINKTVNGTNYYARPENIYLPKSYGNSYDLEFLFRGIDGVYFVHQEYIEDIIKKYRQIKRKDKKSKREMEIKEWRDFFVEKIGVNEVPKIIYIKESVDDPYSYKSVNYGYNGSVLKYKSYLSDEYFKTYKAFERITDYSFEFDIQRLNKKQCELLLKILEINWKSYYKSYFNEQLVYKHRYYRSKYEWTEYKDICYFKHSLLTKHWLPTTKGTTAKPSEVFLDKPEIKELLGDNVPYLTVDLKNEEFIQALGINSDANVKGVLNNLQKLAAQKCKNKDTFTKLYNFVNKKYEGNEDNIKNAFLEHKIIYIPDNSQCYFSSQEVIWKDVSEIFGETRGYLEKYYPKLKAFFVDKLGISEKPTSRDYANVLISLSKKGTCEKNDDKIILKIYSELNNSLNPEINEQLISEEGWWQDFISKPIFWTDKNEFWKNDNDLFVNDNPELYKLFKDSPQIAFLKLPENYYPKIQHFIENAGISYLNKAVTTRLVTSEGKKIEKDLTERIRNLTPYIMRYLYKFEYSSYEKLKKDGIFTRLENLSVYSVENLQVEYILNEQTALNQRNALLYDGNLYVRNDCLKDTDYLAVEISKIFGDIRGLDDFLISLFDKRSKDAIEKLMKLKGITELPEDEIQWFETIKVESEIKFESEIVEPQEELQEIFTKTDSSSNSTPSEIQKDYESTTEEPTKRIEWQPECKPEEVKPHVEKLQFQTKTEHEISVREKREKITDISQQTPKHPKETDRDTLSPKAKIAIGRWGEEYVLKCLKEILIEKYQGGRIVETNDGFVFIHNTQKQIEIYWLNKTEDKGEGYDIKIIKDGNEEYIEVKSTKTDSKEWFDLSHKQWEFMLEMKDKFHIYRVYNAGTQNAKLIIITNPYKMWQEGKLNAYPIRIQV